MRNPQIDSLERDLLDIRARFARATQGLGDRALLWSPDGTVWSIAQIDEHLNLVGEAIAPALGDALSELALKGRSHGPLRYSLTERIFIRMVSPNPPFRVPVPARYAPVVNVTDPKQTIVRFLALIGLARLGAGSDAREAPIPADATTAANMSRDFIRTPS